MWIPYSTLKLPRSLDLQAVTLRPEVPWKCLFSRPLGSSGFSQPTLTALLSFSAAHRPGQAEHRECHRQPRPVRHPGVRCQRLPRAHHELDKVRNRLVPFIMDSWRRERGACSVLAFPWHGCGLLGNLSSRCSMEAFL